MWRARGAVQVHGFLRWDQRLRPPPECAQAPTQIVREACHLGFEILAAVLQYGLQAGIECAGNFSRLHAQPDGLVWHRGFEGKQQLQGLVKESVFQQVVQRDQ